MMQLASTAVTQSPAATLPSVDADGEAEAIEHLLGQAGPLQGSHAVIVAEHGLDLFGALIRRGCLAATCLRPSARPEATAYDLALFPDVTPATALEPVIRDARRAIVPGGRLLIRVSGDIAGRTARALARRLKLTGFISVRVRSSQRWTLIRAERPATSASRQPANTLQRSVA